MAKKKKIIDINFDNLSIIQLGKLAELGCEVDSLEKVKEFPNLWHGNIYIDDRADIKKILEYFIEII